ncbi:MAG: lysophospholipid acyltransferase family protein [Bdellovibrionota bacterium]
MKQSPSVSLSVWWQYLMGQLFYIPLMWWVILGAKLRGLAIKDHKKLRKYYRELTQEGSLPLLICPNHMTYVDSIILIYAFGNHFWYGLNFKKHMWNLVAKEYSKNPLFRFVCYLSKCIYVDREKEKSQNYPALNTAISLLKMHEVVLIFPEGRRSKTGRFDDTKLAYGVGKVVKEVGECNVLCTYLRCPEQGEKSSGFFPRNAHYSILTELVHYKAHELGSEAVSKITEDIATRIKVLEKEYFQKL